MALRGLSLAMFVVLTALPGRALAMILPACENETVLTRMPEPACEVITTVDEETGKTSAAPICDPQGISAIAPPRILPVGDGRIEASRSCGSSSRSTSLGPRSDEPLFSPLHAIAADTTLSGDIAVARPAFRMEMDAFLTRSGGPRCGVARSIFHPPR